MFLSRRISENRPTILLVVLVMLSLASLASGTRAGFVRIAARNVVTTIVHPFWWTFRTSVDTKNRVADFVSSRSERLLEMETLKTRVAEQSEAMRDYRELRAENARLRQMLNYTRRHSLVLLEPARVIAHSESQATLMIDRGRMHGVQEMMCVICPDGVVGLVTEVNWLNSIVFTVNNVNFRVAGLIERSRVRGSVAGSGSSFVKQMCTMTYLDAKDDIARGDRVLTSTESMFPAGYLIGTISDVSDEGYLLRTATVTPAVDPFSLDDVFLVRQAQPAAADLTGIPPTEAARPADSTFPELPSVQEKYAP